MWKYVCVCLVTMLCPCLKKNNNTKCIPIFSAWEFEYNKGLPRSPKSV